MTEVIYEITSIPEDSVWYTERAKLIGEICVRVAKDTLVMRTGKYIGQRLIIPQIGLAPSFVGLADSAESSYSKNKPYPRYTGD